MKLKFVIGIALVSLGILTVAVRADTIVFTENSANSLSVTLLSDGSTFGAVTGGSDHWTWSSSDGSSASLNYSLASWYPDGWAEPSGAGFNLIRDIPQNGGQWNGSLFIDSDISPDSSAISPSGIWSHADGETIPGFLDLTDATGLVSTYDVQFVDLGDTTQTVPDGGATVAMIGGAFIGLAALRRRFAK